MTPRVDLGTSPEQWVNVEPPNLLLRVLWFILIGWWLTGILSAVAWAANATIIGLPVGLWIINRLPFVATMRPPESAYRVSGGVLRPATEQHPILLRAIYFLLVGWWFSGLWMIVAFVLLLSVIGMPGAFWMYGRIGAVTTLYRT
ncbi:MAG: YccF domain-containing protein [Chloroflexota bacterium]|nr:YccF domain-containing protein [Chloroflexia bacterium]MDQ3227531.1 YccF domain-containing protein [Chloroflexota bacterium]